jgi:hypothetical protein
MEKYPKFHLGIVMAGAVSAGAYTAGVMDYLLETLTLWEEKKQDNRRILQHCDGDMERALKLDYDPTVPMHDVVIEVMAGASAGGMTASISALSLFEGLKFYSEVEREADENPAKKNYLESLRLYDAWVNLNDFPKHEEKEKQYEERATFLQMLDTSDIKKKVPSLLNPSPIDGIAQKLLNLQIQKSLRDYPFISNELNLILTVCSLKGIPVDINFDSEKEDLRAPGLRMYVHKGAGHFKFGKRDASQNQNHIIYLNLDPSFEASRDLDELPEEFSDQSKLYEKGATYGRSLEDVMKDKEQQNLEDESAGIHALLDASIASGAFPIGLKPKKLSVDNPQYVKSHIQRIFGIEEDDPNIDVNVGNGSFDFLAIDGGTVNNEPIGEVDKILRERIESTKQADDEMSNYGILMIDPFPNVDEKNSLEGMKEENEAEELEEEELSIERLVPKIITAIRRQAMVKEGDIRDGFKGGTHTRGLIRPSKEGKDGWNALACGSLEGFGGFLHLDLRKHDFELGRRNCQSFLRKHFSIRMDKFDDSPISSGWTREAKKRFEKQKNSGKGDFYLPLIPDVRIPKTKDEKDTSVLSHPGDVCISSKEIIKLRGPISKRVYAIIWGIIWSQLKSIYPWKAKSSKTDTEKSKERSLSLRANRLLNNSWRFLFAKWFYWVVMFFVFILVLPIIILSVPITFIASRMLTSQLIMPIIMKDFCRKGLVDE